MTANYNLEIKFDDNDEGVFYPGQTVKGEKLWLSIAVAINNVKLCFFL